MTFGKLRGARLGALAPLRMRTDNAKAGQSVYNTERWKRISAWIRRRVRACMVCGAIGRRLYVDHVVELADGGAPYDPANLCVLCASCHTKKTHQRRQQRAGVA